MSVLAPTNRAEGIAYRAVMRLAHRFNWHYAPPIYPEGDTHLWCKWCGFRQTVKRAQTQGDFIARLHRG